MGRFGFRQSFVFPILLFHLTGWGAGLASAAPVGLEESRKDLQEVERQIRETSENLQGKRTEERSLTQQLQAVEADLGRIGTRISNHELRLAALERDLSGAEGKVRQTQTDIASLEKKVRKRLAAIYKNGETGLARILFSAGSPAETAEDYVFWGRIVHRDRELLADYRRQVGELEAHLERLAALRKEQQAVLTELARDRKSLEKSRRLKETLLARVRQDRSVLADMLAELKEKAGRLSALVKKLESEKTREYTEKTTVFANRKGRLPWPVEGRVSVGFGSWRDPALGTLRDSQGYEIECSGEKPIAAIGEGRVIFANWFKGYGNLIIVDHGGGYYTLYAQASRLTKKVGDQVREGEVLAYSGYGGSNSVYFEIRHRGTPLDPSPWLAPR